MEAVREQLEVESMKNSIKNEQDWQPVNMLQCKQEIIRRNIETCVSVFKLESKGRTLKDETLNLTESKLVELINSLTVPE